jgi:hypothetical protein
VAKKPETTFKERCQADLKTVDNLWCLKTNEVAVRGIPDLLMCVNGIFVAVELKKSSKDKAVALQSYIGERIKTKAKGLFYVACPETWPRVLMDIRRIASYD